MAEDETKRNWYERENNRRKYITSVEFMWIGYIKYVIVYGMCSTRKLSNISSLVDYLWNDCWSEYTTRIPLLSSASLFFLWAVQYTLMLLHKLHRLYIDISLILHELFYPSFGLSFCCFATLLLSSSLVSTHQRKRWKWHDGIFGENWNNGNWTFSCNIIEEKLWILLKLGKLSKFFQIIHISGWWELRCLQEPDQQSVHQRQLQNVAISSTDVDRKDLISPTANHSFQYYCEMTRNKQHVE